LLEKAKDAIIVTDLANLTIYWNKSAERLYGFTAAEALDKKVDQLLYQNAAEFEAAKLQAMEKGEWRGECLHRTKADRVVTVESHWTLVHDDQGTPKSILIVNTDISDRKNYEAQFLRTQRIESIGTLAGGIAHDLNNTLAPVVMSVELLKQKLLDEQSARMLAILESSANRAATW